jgi:Uma2 family endonuclease
MSEAAQTLMTVDEFLASADAREGKWEIEDGVPYAMAPERIEHARVKLEAVLAFRNAIRRAGLPCEAVVDSVAVRITPRTAYQPDGLVYCGERLAPEAREVPNPVIVVEVLSPSTEYHDVYRKVIGYFAVPSVRFYLILDPRDRSLMHFQRGESGVIELRPMTGGPLRLDPPGLDLTVEDLFGEA